MHSENHSELGVWAKLISLNPSPACKNRSLIKDSYTVGKAATNDIQILDPRIDDVHFRIFKGVHNNDDCYWLENLSNNGTVVENKVVNERNKRQLASGDRIGCLNLDEMTSEVILTYVFCPAVGESNKLKRCREENQKLLDENKEQKKFCDGQKNHLDCTICLSLIYDCVTVWPCLHNFCASCISKWIVQSDVCPNCKQKFSSVKKNFMLNGMINSFKDIRPELKQPQEYYDDKDRKDRIKPLFETVRYSNGAIYEGNWASGRKEGKGKMTYSNRDIYDGDWVNGKREGKGKMIYSDGTVYEGDWINGKYGSKGKITYSNGNVYEGEWTNEMITGKGKLIYANGNIYEGDRLNGWSTGKGKMIFSNGNVYEGDWLNEWIQGKGKMIYSNGDVYEGDWINEKYGGIGKMTYSNGDVYEGDWINGKYGGKGIMIYSNGDIYEGDWAKGKRHGKGKMIYSDGNVYEGKWVNDKKHR